MKRFLYLFLSIFFSIFIILTVPLAKIARPYLPFTNYLLGIEKPITYTFLLGNDTEMRANGGFAGSYTKITLSNTSTTTDPSLRVSSTLEPKQPPLLSLPKSSIDIHFQDIYVPNGQIAGLYVAPPDPIQQAFGKGSWELANADWEPDFPTSAKQIRWFLEKGKETNPDILGIINLTTIKKVLNLAGPFYVPEYKANITPENVYLFLQGKAEVNFFPGSTQKKDALVSVGKALIAHLRQLPISKQISIIKILYSDFTNQNIVIHSLDNDFQTFLEQQNIAGSFPSVISTEVERSPSITNDIYSLIETNLGANKANQFITRQTTHTVSVISNKDKESPTSTFVISSEQGESRDLPPSEEPPTSTFVISSEQGESRDLPPPEKFSPTPNIISPSSTIQDPRSKIQDLTSNSIRHQVTIKFHNSSPEQNPNPPIHYGGNYIAYLRIYLPKDAKNISVTQSPENSSAIPQNGQVITPSTVPVISSPAFSPGLDPGELSESRDLTPSPSTIQNPTSNIYHLKSKYNLTELGFWHTTKAGNSSEINLFYDLPLPRHCEEDTTKQSISINSTSNPRSNIQDLTSGCYTLTILKQNGFPSSPQSGTILDHSFSNPLHTDFIYP